jgi:hypothetical protein
VNSSISAKNGNHTVSWGHLTKILLNIRQQWINNPLSIACEPEGFFPFDLYLVRNPSSPSDLDFMISCPLTHFIEIGKVG